ncbi:MAG TPA: hypothetical protein VKF61_00260 [Candidatus Polarisedimenticolia bacterium]|nr:hypothetical protein [Candidatus Polarisedimenticolia bacterium]
MTPAGRPLLTGFALFALAGALSLFPGWLPGALSGAVLALFLPGYALLLCLDAPARIDRLTDVAHCVATSLAVVPLALRLAGAALPFDRPHLVGVLAGVTLALLGLGALRAPAPFGPAGDRTPRALLAVVILTLVLLAPTLAIGPTPEGGETRVKGWDLNNHLAIAESIASRGLPPRNPFLASDSPFYYHTYFHILLAAVLAMAGQGASAYLLISSFTLLLAAVFLFTFHRAVSEHFDDDRIALLSLPFVSLVGGFDLVPMVVKALSEKEGVHGPIAFFLSHWNVDGWVSNRGMLVPTFFANFYWSSHAVAAMVVFLLALIHLKRAGSDVGSLVAAGICLAAMAGYNGYVALGGAATLVLLRGIDGVRFVASRFRSGRGVLLRSAVAAGLAIVLSLPVLNLYAGGRRDVDKFRWARPGPLVPLQFIVEFGPALILGLAGLVLWRRRGSGGGELAPFLSMGAVSLPLVGLVASTGENNDLAMRVSMLSWLCLAVLGGVALSRLGGSRAVATPLTRILHYGSLAALGLGSLSVVWFAFGAALAKPTLPPDEVAAGRWVREHVAPGRLVQGSPLRNNPDLVYLSGHPAVLSDTWTARLFYSDPEEFEQRMASLSEAFSTADPGRACDLLKSLRVSALVMGPPDTRDFPRLSGLDSWTCLSQVYARGEYRVYSMSP